MVKVFYFFQSLPGTLLSCFSSGRRVTFFRALNVVKYFDTRFKIH